MCLEPFDRQPHPLRSRLAGGVDAVGVVQFRRAVDADGDGETVLRQEDGPFGVDQKIFVDARPVDVERAQPLRLFLRADRAA